MMGCAVMLCRADLLSGGRHALLEAQLAEEDEGPLQRQHHHHQHDPSAAGTTAAAAAAGAGAEGSFSPCCPNDTYMSETSNFALITGPNMSGKSTYLRQVGQAVVMAQAGCFVPASFASLAPFERLHARAVHCGGASSDKETSSFMVEMVETAQILRTLGHRSLVLMDELGR